MKFEKFTVKAREAVSDSQNLAGKYGNPEIRSEHMLMVLLTQDKGVVPGLIGRIGADLEGLKRGAAQLLDKLPKVSGGAQARLRGN